MRKNKVYLDHAATVPVSEQNLKRLVHNLNWSNPSSYYENGIAAKADIERAREIIAHSIGADPDEIIFTSGGSEANTMAINGFLAANEEYDKCICSNIEHSSVLYHKHCVPDIKVDRYGIVILDTVPNKKSFCSVMLVNNEIGSIQPIRKIAEKVHSHGGVLMCDGVQALGKEFINVHDLDIDLMSFSGHKIGALKGVGFLYLRNGITIDPLIIGTQESDMRGGTYNHMGIMSLAYAIESMSLGASRNKMRWLRDGLLQKLLELDGVLLNGSVVNRCSCNVNIRIPKSNYTGQELVALMDSLGFEISAGSACHSGDSEPSHVLKAIGLSDEDALKSIRITLGAENTNEEIEDFVSTLTVVLGL